MKKIIVAIDGYSGTGKSSTARAVAEHLKYSYVDTGAMYRSVTLFLLQNQIAHHDGDTLDRALGQVDLHFRFNPSSGQSEIILNDECVEEEIRSPSISSRVSEIAAIKAVRRKMVALQQQMGRQKGLVMDGRDIGTVVFPDAELKIFMTADGKIRAQRRLKELEQNGIKSNLDEVLNNLLDRDQKDTTRADSPLRKAKDAIEIDTTMLTFAGQVAKIVNLANEIIHAG